MNSINLIKGFKRKNGRNNSGSLVFRRRGGQPVNLYRYIDFYYFLALKLPYIILNYIYDSFRNSFLMSIVYLNGIFSYRIGISNVKFYFLYFTNTFWYGCVNFLYCFEVGKFVTNIPFVLNKKVGFCRAAGTGLLLLRVDIRLKLAILKIKLKKKYIVSVFSLGVLGRVSNLSYRENLLIGKAGYKRCMGVKPVVRGIARNPVDHPNGGRTPGGKVYRSYTNLIARSSKKTNTLRNSYLKNKYILKLYV